MDLNQDFYGSDPDFQPIRIRTQEKKFNPAKTRIRNTDLFPTNPFGTMQIIEIISTLGRSAVRLPCQHKGFFDHFLAYQVIFAFNFF